MNSLRKIVIQWMPENDYSNIVKLLKDFNDYSFSNDLLLLNCSKKQFNQNDVDELKYQSIECPNDCDNNSKMKNFILQYMSSLSNSFRFLHIIEGNTNLLKDPSIYINEVEKTMDALDYSIYFSTITDRCNYVFNKFCPRLTIDIDDENIKSKMNLPSSISFTSHSNTSWTIYDYSKYDVCPQTYNEQFSIAMFMIIEYLARRKATKKNDQLFYMNQYLSVPSEIGVFNVVKTSQNDIDPKKMQEEDALFKSMKIDYAPDNNIDVVLDALYAKIKHKMI